MVIRHEASRNHQKRFRHRTSVMGGAAAAIIAFAAVGCGISTQGDPERNPDRSAGATGASAATERDGNLAGKYPRIFIAGDSISEGWTATRPEDGYREILRAELQPDSLTFHGRGGATVEDLEQWTIVRGSDLVIVELGTNNAARSQDPGEFGTSYAAYIDRVMAENSAAVLVCLGIWADYSQRSADRFDEIIAQECGDHGGTFVDLQQIYTTPGSHDSTGEETFIGTTDGWHPDDDGMRMIAEAILDVL